MAGIPSEVENGAAWEAATWTGRLSEWEASESNLSMLLKEPEMSRLRST